MLAELGVAGQPHDRIAPRGEVVPGLEHVALELREEPGHLFTPHGHHARRADDEVRPAVDRPRGEQGQHLARLAEAHFVGEQTMAADIAEVVQPLDAAPLVGPQAFGQRGGRDGWGEHALAPRLDLGGKRDFEAVIAEQRKNQIGRQFAVGMDGLLNRAAPLGERLPPLGRQRHDAEAGQDDGRAAAPGQHLHLLLGQQAFAGAEDPAELEAGPVALLGVGLDFHRALALQQVRGILIEFDGEITPPHRQQGAQEFRDLRQQVEHIDVRLLVVMEVRLAGVGRETDEFAAFAGADVGRRGAVAIGMPVAIAVAVGLTQRGGAGLVGIQPERLEGQSLNLRFKNQQERPRGAAVFAVGGRTVRGRNQGRRRLGGQLAGQR